MPKFCCCKRKFRSNTISDKCKVRQLTECWSPQLTCDQDRIIQYHSSKDDKLILASSELFLSERVKKTYELTMYIQLQDTSVIGLGYNHGQRPVKLKHQIRVRLGCTAGNDYLRGKEAFCLNFMINQGNYSFLVRTHGFNFWFIWCNSTEAWKCLIHVV